MPSSLSTPQPATIHLKVITAACVGTFLERYDFLTFASLATFFGMLFFTQGNPVAALLTMPFVIGLIFLSETHNVSLED